MEGEGGLWGGAGRELYKYVKIEPAWGRPGDQSAKMAMVALHSSLHS